MSEINVLVSRNAMPKLKGGGILKEGNPSNDDSAAMQFAAILGGWMAQTMGQGQGSGFQSSNPAGKEANSGQTGIQGLEGMLGSLRTIAGLNLGSASGQNQQASDAMMKAISPELRTLLSQNYPQGDVIDLGLGSGQPQGEKSPLTELDQYRVIIAQLLQDMSGEISKASPRPTEIQGLLTQISQGLNLHTLGVESEDSQPNIVSSNVQRSLQSTLQSQPILTQPESRPLAVSQNQVASAAQVANSSDIQSGLAQTTLGSSQSTLQSQPILTRPESNPLAVSQELVAGIQSRPSEQTVGVATPVVQNSSQSDGLPTGNHLLQMDIQTEIGQNGTGKEKDNRSANGKITNSNTGTEGTNSILGNSNLANLALGSAPDAGNETGVSPNLPIWQQVAQELQVKVLHELSTVRELNIQLHPAELGQISISLTLDKGQVHMHLLASEAATGQILKDNFPQLRETLSQSGVQCGMMQMGLSDSNQKFNQGRHQNFGSQIKTQSKKESENPIDLDDVRIDGLSSKGLDQGMVQSNRINVTA